MEITYSDYLKAKDIVSQYEKQIKDQPKVELEIQTDGRCGICKLSKYERDENNNIISSIKARELTSICHCSRCDDVVIQNLK